MNRDCPECGSGFSVKYNSSTQKFCSRSCACRYNAQRRVGEKNPNWRGGVTNHLLYETYQDMIARAFPLTDLSEKFVVSPDTVSDFWERPA